MSRSPELKEMPANLKKQLLKVFEDFEESDKYNLQNQDYSSEDFKARTAMALADTIILLGDIKKVGGNINRWSGRMFLPHSLKDIFIKMVRILNERKVTLTKMYTALKDGQEESVTVDH